MSRIYGNHDPLCRPASLSALLPALVAALLAAGCCRSGRSSSDRKPTPASEVTTGKVTHKKPHASAAPTPGAPVASAASAVTVAPPSTGAPSTPGKPVTASATPDWASAMPQVKTPLSYLARGIKGPIPVGFEGLLVCQYKVARSSWDTVVPFVGSSSDALPDVVAWTGQGGPTAIGPNNATTGVLTFGGITLDPGGPLRMRLDDADLPPPPDHIADLSFDGTKGLPLQQKTDAIEVTCAGVPAAALQGEITPREGALVRALDAMEKTPATATRIESARPRIEAARSATLELVSFVGHERPSVRAAFSRIAAYESALSGHSLDTWLAAANKGADASGWITLPSARVHPDASDASHFQLIVGPAGATYDWRTHSIGRIALTGITTSGERAELAFVHFFVGGQELEGLDVRLPPGKTIEVTTSMNAGVRGPSAIVLEEAGRQVVLAPRP